MEVIIRLFTFLLSILHQILRPYFWYINRRTEARIPSAENPILKLSAVVVAEKIRRRELSSEAVVTAYIERIKEVNDVLNAVIEDRFEAAIRDARICDQKLAAGVVSAKELEAEQPLYGVPITVKESCAVKDLSHTGCTVARIGVKADYDGTAVEVMKNAGAIPLCVTNTPELCLGFESNNKVFGKTNNPYDIRRTAGGSSGGEGSLLAASASIIGIGSDIAGSIRVPALFNGVFGHKPTPGVISIAGHYPYTEDPDFKRYLVIGPMTRYAEDLTLAVKVMANKNRAALRLDVPVDVKSLKFRYMEDFGGSFGLLSATQDLKRAVKNAVSYLRSIGADVQRVNIGQLKDSLEASLALLCRENVLPQMLLNPEDPKFRVIVVRLSFSRSCTSHVLTSLYFPLQRHSDHLTMIIGPKLLAIGTGFHLKIYKYTLKRYETFEKQQIMTMKKVQPRERRCTEIGGHRAGAMTKKMSEYLCIPNLIHFPRRCNFLLAVLGCAVFFEQHERHALTEAGKWFFGLSHYTISAIVCKGLKDVKFFIPQSKRPWYHNEIETLRRIFTDLLGTDGVFLIPTFVRSAPYHNAMTLQLDSIRYCVIFNILEFPSTHVPIGFDSEGLPVGIQVVALPMQDRLCLAVAKELEKGFGGWIPPSPSPSSVTTSAGQH